MTQMFAALCFVMGAGMVAAAAQMIGRLAMPRAPRVFHLLIVPPLLTSASAIAGIGWLSLSGNWRLLGMEQSDFAILFLVSGCVLWWGFVGYGEYHRRKTNRARREHRDR